MRGETLSAMPYLLGVASCGALAFLAWTVRLLGDERIIFGRS
ncbi:ABC-type Na+ efflux pump, permease component [Cystobacter fuscus DSM 2262]|uniref:ABC-type Na+ efflux pump, permease component n=1 Tax=Cystobacter fuscus (strain ATCC 25194 / DSM 2262 / NBRC 100088 / M29) TaxID=1242864 RepID=S9PAT2_CYSF2|nr:hypothetical protein [Cystobacter fuscus]EPX61505.1 ABC-type Na+ efflux pump, permease component [Cystobacter fuscus DSM 2262]